jgi:hypothetical protein
MSDGGSSTPGDCFQARLTEDEIRSKVLDANGRHDPVTRW